MERLGMSDLYVEAKMAMDKFHMPFHVWLQIPRLVRDFQLLVYKLSVEEENYYNTPAEKRFNYFNRK